MPIHKKGDRNNPDNYRGISLLNTGYKIYSKIIAKRLTEIAEVLLEEQNRFRNRRSVKPTTTAHVEGCRANFSSSSKPALCHH